MARQRQQTSGMPKFITRTRSLRLGDSPPVRAPPPLFFASPSGCRFPSLKFLSSPSAQIGCFKRGQRSWQQPELPAPLPAPFSTTATGAQGSRKPVG
ncbi:hypothetical protein RJ55_08416 [Drechmeria coniospora]|nr:hypothetical protein RJ55_08416 [Drechmeria coniospora]